MNVAPPDQRGLALGAWGAVQATAAGLGVALGGIVRDVLLAVGPAGAGTALTPYVSVYVIEVILLLTAIVVMFQLVQRPDFRSKAEAG
jgi:BCD family chlorophyll transporter-like MFS transporter